MITVCHCTKFAAPGNILKGKTRLGAAKPSVGQGVAGRGIDCQVMLSYLLPNLTQLILGKAHESLLGVHIAVV